MNCMYCGNKTKVKETLDNNCVVAYDLNRVYRVRYCECCDRYFYTIESGVFDPSPEFIRKIDSLRFRRQMSKATDGQIFFDNY